MRDHRRQAAPTATLNSMKLETAKMTMAAAPAAPKEEQRLTNRQIRQEEKNNQRTVPRTLMQPTLMG